MSIVSCHFVRANVVDGNRLGDHDHDGDGQDFVLVLASLLSKKNRIILSYSTEKRSNLENESEMHT